MKHATEENARKLAARLSRNQGPAWWMSNENKKRRDNGKFIHSLLLFASPEKKGNRFINIQKVIVQQLWWLLVLEVSVEANMSIRADLLNAFVSSRIGKLNFAPLLGGKKSPTASLWALCSVFCMSLCDCKETQCHFGHCTFQCHENSVT